MIRYLPYAAAGILVVVFMARVVILRRGVKRRLASMVAKIEGGSALSEVEDQRTLEAAFARLERAVDTGAARDHALIVETRRLTEACAVLDHGLVVADEHGRIRYTNREAERYVGGRNDDAVVDAAVRRLLRTAIDRQLAPDGRLPEGGALQEELELFTPVLPTLVLAANALDDGTRQIGAAVVVGDVSAARRLDSVRRDFVANISHELKTPVGALGLLAETLSDSLDEPEVARRLAGRLAGESVRLARVIEDLLDLSRLESEESPIRDLVSIDVVAAEAADRVRAGLPGSGVVVEVAVEPGVVVTGDRRQLSTAVYNLVENAVKYSDPGTTVRVGALREPGGTVEISVADQGIGIPKQDMGRVFERFYRVDRARSRETGGTGLGLAIVRHVAVNHGGEIHVASEEGVGSTFTMRISAGPAGARPIVLPGLAEPEVRGKHRAAEEAAATR